MPEEEPLEEADRTVLEQYIRHLRMRRQLSEHTVRAYRADLDSLLRHLRRLGVDDVAGASLRHLRSWLANSQSRGQARTTLQRRAAAARVFFAWAEETGRTPTNPAATLRSPKVVRGLTATLDS